MGEGGGHAEEAAAAARVCSAQNGKGAKVLHFVTGATPNTTRAPVLSSTAGMMTHADHLSRCCCSCRAGRLALAPLDIYIYIHVRIHIYTTISAVGPCCPQSPPCPASIKADQQLRSPSELQMHRWHALGLAARQLSLPITLTCGQSFRWLQLPEGRWGGVVGGSLVLLRQSGDAIEFSPLNCGPAVGEGAAEKHTRALLLDYFNATAPLESMYEEWSRCAPLLRAWWAARSRVLFEAGRTRDSSSCRPCSPACACCVRTRTSACFLSSAAATTTLWCA